MSGYTDTAKEREKLALLKDTVLLRCEGCMEEMNCHPVDEMFVTRGGTPYCDQCMDGGDDQPPWTASPDPLQIASAALDEVDRLRRVMAEIADWRPQNAEPYEIPEDVEPWARESQDAFAWMQYECRTALTDTSQQEDTQNEQ